MNRIILPIPVKKSKPECVFICLMGSAARMHLCLTSRLLPQVWTPDEMPDHFQTGNYLNGRVKKLPAPHFGCFPGFFTKRDFFAKYLPAFCNISLLCNPSMLNDAFAVSI